MKQLFVYTDIILQEAGITPVISLKEKTKRDFLGFFIHYHLFIPVIDAKAKS